MLWVVNSSGNLIGGTTVAARNVISANTGIGVSVVSGDDNVVAGNFIGTDVTGTEDCMGNGFAGVRIGSADRTQISGNVVSGNTYGVLIAGGTENSVTGNKIGTNAAGDFKLPNYIGVSIQDAAGQCRDAVSRRCFYSDTHSFAIDATGAVNYRKYKFKSAYLRSVRVKPELTRR